MSLSCIAQVLQDIDDATPRKLVDQLILVKKKKKQQQKQDIVSDTYTLLPSTRSSLPLSSTNTIDVEQSEHEFTVQEYSGKSGISKLSLDSKSFENTSVKNRFLKSTNFGKVENDSSPIVEIHASTFLERTKVKKNNNELSFLGTYKNLF